MFIESHYMYSENIDLKNKHFGESLNNEMRHIFCAIILNFTVYIKINL